MAGSTMWAIQVTGLRKSFGEKTVPRKGVGFDSPLGTSLSKGFELGVGELDLQRGKVLLEVLEGQRARNRQHHR